MLLRALVLAVVCVTAACAAPAPETTAATADKLAVGVFAECALPAPLQPVLEKLYEAMEGRGIEISAEVIILYDYDLTKKENTLEVLFGGAVAGELAGALGIDEGEVNGWLSELGAEGGILGAATVGLDFGGDWEGINFALVGYEGADVFAGSGGAWQVLWTTDRTENAGDKSGFWGAITLTTNGACKAGGLVAASKNDVNVLWTAWEWLTGGSSSNTAPVSQPSTPDSSDADAGADASADAAEADGGAEADGAAPAALVCGMPSSGVPSCDSCEASSCCAEAQTCAGDADCANLIDCQQACGDDTDCSAACGANAPDQANSELNALDVCLNSCPCP